MSLGYHTSCGQYKGMATFFLLLTRVKIGNRLRMVLKVKNVRLGVFPGDGCHHPNSLECLSGRDAVAIMGGGGVLL